MSPELRSSSGPETCPAEGRHELVQRLGGGARRGAERARAAGGGAPFDPLTPIVVKTAVGEEQVDYLYEHQSEFPGIKIVQIYLRGYPYSSLAAELLGYTGEISPEELKQLRKSYRAGDRIGKAGIEAAYDRYLRGRTDWARSGSTRSAARSRYEPRQESSAGYAMRLTLDMKSPAGSRGGAPARDRSRARERPVGGERRRHRRTRSARRCRSRDGVGADVQAVGVHGASQSEEARSPLLRLGGPIVQSRDRRALSARVDVEAGDRARRDAGARVFAIPVDPVHRSAEYGLDRQGFRNWNPYVNRPMTLPEALAESCDTYFYEIGNRFYKGGSESRVRMQQWAQRFGFGAPTGLDIGGEADGLVPTPEWRRKKFQSDWDRAWKPGDSIQLAMGQKDMLVTPLQMRRVLRDARQRGQLVKPYLVSDVEQPGAKGSPRVVLRRFAAARLVRRRRSRGAQGGSGRPVRRNALRQRHVGRRLRGLRVPSRARRAQLRKPSGYPVTRSGISRISRGGAAGGRLSRRGRGVRADRERRSRIERGRSRGTQSVRAILRRRGGAGDSRGYGLRTGLAHDRGRPRHPRPLRGHGSRSLCS